MYSNAVPLARRRDSSSKSRAVLCIGEHRRGFIQDDQARIAGQSARDLEQLLLADAQLASSGVHVDGFEAKWCEPRPSQRGKACAI